MFYRPGLRLAEDKHNCEDIDECAEGSSHCSQGCENKDPRFDEGKPLKHLTMS